VSAQRSGVGTNDEEEGGRRSFAVAARCFTAAAAASLALLAADPACAELNARGARIEREGHTVTSTKQEKDDRSIKYLYLTHPIAQPSVVFTPDGYDARFM
jgi:hypothetical protein